jgi:cytochrome o ubiquinol oxidase subunit 2
MFARSRQAFLVAMLALLAGCQRAVLDPAGDIALQQRNLIYVSVGVMLVIIVPVLILIVVFAWRYRKGGGGIYDPHFTHSTSLELVIWSAPLLIIIALGAVTWSSTHLLDPFRPLDRIAAGKPIDRAVAPLRVQVVSLDWKWLFIYPDQGIAAVNELVLPVDREVRFDITSSNMMNGFYAPTLAGMIYAMPGMQSQLHAVLNRPGEYEGFSSNYSGAGFSDMRFKLRGVDQTSFDRWVSAAKAGGRPLQTAEYLALAKPSEKAPIMRFGSVAPDLFDRVVNRCVAPGTSCMRDVMAHDAHMTAGSMPPAHGASSPGSPPPKGAILKARADIAPAPNVTKPPAPRTPGVTKPDSPKNRDMPSLLPTGSGAPDRPLG